MSRLLRALRAFWRPGVARGWPGALLMSTGKPIVLAHPEDEVFFQVGMELCDDAENVLGTVDTFDRRKGRREAFADAWNQR